VPSTRSVEDGAGNELGGGLEGEELNASAPGEVALRALRSAGRELRRRLGRVALVGATPLGLAVSQENSGS
jgi:hypothetical protein